MVVWCKVLLILVVIIFTCAEISIDNDGGYKNIVIGITPELPENQVESLLLDLEELFQKTSDALRTASQGNAFFKELVFVIPRKYNDWITKRNLFSGAKYFKKPDIFVTVNDPFINPYTVQHGGCGRSGLRIHIPKEFLETSETNKARSLVRQWARYRYGVFDESGFPNDEVYPACYRIPGSNEIRVSDCTNEEAIYNIRENLRAGTDGSPNACSAVPAANKNDQIVSSIMTNIDFPKMKFFCDNDTHPHNRIAPTKQNALCGEQSTWEVISRHSDFKVKRKYSSNVKASFKYVVESNPRLVIAVDSSKNMGLNGRLDLVRNAFTYFAFYDLPNNSTIGFIDMKSKEGSPSMRNIQSVEDAQRLLDIFPDVSTKDEDIRVHSTIQRIIEVLKLDVSDIIIVTATDITEETWVDNIATMLISSKVVLHVIYFEQKRSKPVLLESVAKSSGGSFFYIAEGFPSGSSVSSLTLLYEAFRSFYESFSWRNRNHVLVDQKTFSSNCSPNCTMSFPVDNTIKSFQVLITAQSFTISSPVVRDSIVLENGEQRITFTDRSFAYKAEIPAFLFTIENTQPKLWNLTFERRSGYNQPIVVIIRATNAEYGDILSMHSWASFDERSNAEIAKRPPITIYSEIKKENNPVIGAKVVAFIHQVSENIEKNLQLIDSGEGDPDITKNDGIYSRYLTDVNEAGYHSITTVADKHSSQYAQGQINGESKELYCCGSFVPTSVAYDSGPFRRVTTYQSFFVKSQYAKINYPPRKVMDLRVEKVQVLENGIMCYVLKWTAPGGNYDVGKAASYDIKVFSSREDALNKFDYSYVLTIRMLDIQGPLLDPMEAGTIQTALVEITNITSGTYYIAMKTVSPTGKYSDVSNVVQILHIVPTALPLFTDSGSSKFSFTDDDTTNTNRDNDTATESDSNVGLAIGLTCGILLLLIIIGIIIFIYCVRYKKDKNATNQSCSQNAKKTESNDALCKSNGGGNISIISPANPWGFDSLMSPYESPPRNRNVETNSIRTMQQNKETDSSSLTSSKYSYDNKIDQHSLYDPIYYQVRNQDEINYPYNSNYTQFNPNYTSSLRRFHNEEVLGIPDPSENASFYSYITNRNNSSRLKTDV